MWALVALEALASGIDLLFGPWARVHWEERFNARAGAQFACGHLDRWWALQYRTFCGGCTGESLMAAPLFSELGPTVMVWKLIPFGFHVLVTALGAFVANRISWKAGVAWCLLMLGAPGFYRDLIHTGWGNHAESAAFTLGALALLAAGAGRRRWVQALCIIASGVVTGLGLWFAHISVHAVPALAVAAVLLWWRGAPLFALGGALGAYPWFWVHESRPYAKGEAVDWFSMFTPAPLDGLADWLWGPFFRDGLWPLEVNPMAGRLVVEYGDLGVLPSLYWFVLWVAALAGMGLVIRRWRDQPVVSWFPAVALAALLVAYALRYDLWDDNPSDIAFATFHLRYRAPLIPLLFLGAAMACTAPRWFGRAALVGVVAAAGLGIGLRVGKWGPLRAGFLDVRVYAPDGRTDQTVPSGDPPQRNRDKQSRPQDLGAAFQFLTDHEDRFPECRYDHLSETGRRIGLALSERPEDVVVLVHTASRFVSDTESRRHLANGFARALIGEHGEVHADIVPLLDAMPDGFDQDFGEAVGRRAWRALFESEGTLLADPRVFTGACSARGQDWIAETSLQGELPPAIFRDDVGTFEDHVGPCITEQGTWDGLGRGWARWVGCSDEEDLDERARQGWTEGCAAYRQ